MTILEAIQHLDAPTHDGLEEFHYELAVKRLGMSDTVAAQIERFLRLADRGRRVEAEEAAALFRLAGRRNDAGLVFADAGRQAGRRAMRSTAGSGALGLRGMPGFARNGLGFAIARRAARIFDAILDRTEGLTFAVIPDPPSALTTPHAVGCGFYGSAIAAILRDLTDFDGAMFHVKCRSRGDAECRWSEREG